VIIINKEYMLKGGWKWSEESKNKLRLSKLGKKLSQEHCEKLRIAHLGYKVKEETKMKISNALRGRKIGPSKLRGRKLSPEHIAKMIAAQKGVKCPNKGLKGHPKYGGFVKGDKHSEETKNKISMAGKGRPSPRKGVVLSIETRKRISLAGIGRPAWNKGKTSELSGEKHYNWKGGSSKQKYVLFSKHLKAEVIERDNFKCQICGCPESECIRRLDVHHIDYNKKNYNKSNLIALCMSCH